MNRNELEDLMLPKNQFRLANFLMLCGVLPWIVVLGWVSAILLVSDKAHPGRIFMLDPIGMIGLIMMVFIYSVVLSGIGVWWSFSLTQKFPELWSKKATTLKAIIGLTLGIPMLCLCLAYIGKFF
jgi:hypothetical protein